MRRMVAVALVACVGCGGTRSQEGDTQLLVECRTRAGSLKNDLRDRQLKLIAARPGAYSEHLWKPARYGPHTLFTDDPRYKKLYDELWKVISANNRILDKNPTWTAPRLDDNLD